MVVNVRARVEARMWERSGFGGVARRRGVVWVKDVVEGRSRRARNVCGMVF